mmetsp:Transcript_87422/g.276177  ORF Transcript_87422/g.276177 Transcript_87422/m.276177 type:complete len:226 (-) Transcript_87422:114-791(-)
MRTTRSSSRAASSWEGAATATSATSRRGSTSTWAAAIRSRGTWARSLASCTAWIARRLVRCCAPRPTADTTRRNCSSPPNGSARSTSACAEGTSPRGPGSSTCRCAWRRPRKPARGGAEASLRTRPAAAARPEPRCGRWSISRPSTMSRSRPPSCGCTRAACTRFAPTSAARAALSPATWRTGAPAIPGARGPSSTPAASASTSATAPSKSGAASPMTCGAPSRC